MGAYLIPAHEVETEITVVNSRFITTTGPIFSPEEARAVIARIRSRFPDASHHVAAYIIGHGNSLVTHCTDDGEPSGTAGRPVLAVLQGSGLGDIITVVTRYFGGTKLGTGGLVRAYTDAAQAGLKILPRARKVATHSVLLSIQYTYLERARQLAKQVQGLILEETFASDVTLTIQLPIENLKPLEISLANLTSGTATLVIIETHPDTILPVN